MAITWANILNWESGSLESIAKDLLEANQVLRKAYEDGEDALGAVRSEGEAVTAMRATTLTNLASLERALTNVNGALLAIEGARDGVATVMSLVNSTLAFAAENDCTIHPDGSITGEGTKNRRGEPSIALAKLGHMIKDAITYADQVDTDLYHALQDINNDRYTDGDGANNKVVGIPDFPQPNWTPSQVAAWWNSLPDDRKQLFMDHRPDEIRHLDGLPAYARDRANKHALDGYLHTDGTYRAGAFEESKEELSAATEEYNKAKKEYLKAASETSTNHIPADLREKYRQAAERMRVAQEHYDDLSAIRRQTNDFERAKSGLPPAYLLDFDYDKDHQRTTAIVSSGNPDTATHVSTLVPGIGTNVRGDLGDYMEINERLRKQTKHTGINPNNVATISYLGYVAPKNDGTNIRQAADIGFADRAAPKLARFEEGLRASAEANNHNFLNTLIGHSYGSTTSGKSMTLVAPGTVDRFIMCGSPGSGAHSIDAYNIPKKYVYESSIPEGDAVQGLGPDASYGTNPRKLEGITHLSGDATDAKDYWHTYDSLLKHPFDPGKASADYLANSFKNHMAYFEKDTRTSQDFANIIAGEKQTTDKEWAALEEARAKEASHH